MDLKKVQLLPAAILVLTHLAFATDQEITYKKRAFVSKARADYIKKQKGKNGNDPEPEFGTDPEPSVRVPLCAYVEEEVPMNEDEEEENAPNNEQRPFQDPALGCISCQLEPYEQCNKVPHQQCELVPDPNCQICPPIASPRQVNLDITDQDEEFEKCDGSVSKDRQGRLIVLERKCKKFSSNRCKLARNLNLQECQTREICYKKPRLLHSGESTAMVNMKCKTEKLPPRISLKKVVRKLKDCSSTCPKVRKCQTVQEDKCETTQIRICDRLPPEKCERVKPKVTRRIVLKCSEIAEIPHDLAQSLNGNNSQR